jgi:hypothetical protein
MSATAYGLLVVSTLVLIVGVIAHLSMAHAQWHTALMGLGSIGVILTGSFLLYTRKAV